MRGRYPFYCLIIIQAQKTTVVEERERNSLKKDKPEEQHLLYNKSDCQKE